MTISLNAQTAVKMVSPRVTSPANGAEMYSAYCAACHGAHLRGDGAAAAALSIHPADLTLLTSQNKGKFPTSEVYSAIKGDTGWPAQHAAAGMPAWGTVFSSMRHDDSDVCLRMANLVRYIETAQAK